VNPDDFVLFQNIALADAATGVQTSTVGEPSVANNGRQIFLSGNWYCTRSIDNGNSWQYVNPFNTLPTTAGGFCCDQVVLYDPSRDLFFWLLQYIQAPGGSNVLRVAVKRGPTLQNNASWYWWDFAPANVNAQWNLNWFDYPDLALTNDHLWLSSNVFNTAGQWQGASVLRLPLDALAAGTGFSYNFFNTTNNGSLRFTQGATDTMYFASHNNRSQVRLFRWADSSGTIFWNDIGVNTWSGGVYSAPGPDGRDWLGRADPRITGAWVGDGVVGLMWTANARGSRPFPHIRVARIDERTLGVIDQPDLWSSTGAWAYPAAAANCRGHVGISCFFGGGTWGSPAHIVGLWDDMAPGWSIRVARYSTNGPAGNAWGDYLSVRPHSPDALTWIASGYTIRGGTDRRDILPGYVHFGRRRDQGAVDRWENC